VDVDLDERAVTDGFEAVNFAGLDDEDVAGGAFEGLPVDGPEAPAVADKLDFIVGMAVRARAFAGQRAQQEDRYVDVAVLGADKFMGTADKRQIFLTDVVHADSSDGFPCWMRDVCILVCVRADQAGVIRRSDSLQNGLDAILGPQSSAALLKSNFLADDGNSVAIANNSAHHDAINGSGALIGLLVGIAMTLGRMPLMAEPGAPSGYAFYLFWIPVYLGVASVFGPLLGLIFSSLLAAIELWMPLVVAQSGSFMCTFEWRMVCGAIAGGHDWLPDARLERILIHGNGDGVGRGLTLPESAEGSESRSVIGQKAAG
jgi:hypothetical protein